MSLFPAYSSTSSAATTKSDAQTGEEQPKPNWLSLKSFDDKKVVQLNKEFTVDRTDDKSEDRHRNRDRDRDRHRERDKDRHHKRGKSWQHFHCLRPSLSRSLDHRSSDDRRRHDDRRSESKSLPKPSIQSNLAKFLSNKTFIEETGLTPEHAYRVDTNRDKNNLIFDSLYFKNVAKYDKHKTINLAKRKRSKNDESGPKAKKKRYFSHENKALLSKSAEKVKPEVTSICGFDFIPIQSNQPFSHLSANTKTNASNPLGVYDKNTALWSEGKGPSNESSEPQSSIKFKSMKDENSETSIGPNRAPTREQMIYEKTEEFNAYLKDNEADIEKWLKFIAFQDKCVEPVNTSKDKVEGKSLDIYVSEKKLAICERALTYNPKSIDLLLCRLEIVTNIWEYDNVVKEWKRLTFVFPNSMKVWRKYIEFTHHNITNFSVSKTLKVYEKCVQTLSKMQEKTFQSHRPPENLEQELVSILSSYSHFLRAVGQTERAIAVFQALIEFNLFTPTLLTSEMSVQVLNCDLYSDSIAMKLTSVLSKDCTTLFEPFWDSGCPRFGEDGAVGWSQVMVNKNAINAKTNSGEIQSFLDTEENKIVSEKCDKSVVWLKFELLRQRFHWLPARDTEDEEVDDPERVVCSDDVTSMLIRFREESAKYQLVKEFLRFLSVSDDKCDKRVNYFEPDVNITNFAIDLPLFPPYFDQNTIVTNIFKTNLQLFSGHFKTDLVMNWIQYEKSKTNDRMSAKQMRKFFKDLLRDESFRNDLNVWSEFATFEYSLADNRSEGRKVFQMAIQMTLNSEDKESLFVFVRKYVELELGITSLQEMSEDFTKQLPNDSTTDDLCLKALLSVSCGQMVSNTTPSLVLKAVNNLNQTEPSIDRLFSLVVIVYLTKGTSHATQVIEDHLCSPKLSSAEEVDIFSLYLKLLLLNIRRNIAQSLRPLRTVLDRALDSHPTEPQFLSLFINIEFMSNVFHRMRRYFTRTYNSVFTDSSSTDNWTLILYAIHSELKCLNKVSFEGYDTNSGIVNKVRVLFERAVNCRQLLYCVTLWRLYLRFEINCKNLPKAKSVLYRALQNCPFSKVLFMDGIQYFGQKLQELTDIMTEKELRVRTPLEEIDLLVNNLQ